MNNSKSIKDDKIDLFDVISIIWKGKWQIIFITFLSSLIGIYYIANKPNSFDVTLPISIIPDYELIEFFTINEILDDNEMDYIKEKKNGYPLDSDAIFQMFVKEFKDYEEMTYVLSKNVSVNERIKDLSENDKRVALSQYARSFSIVKPQKNALPYKISFRWASVSEGFELLNEALNKIFEKIRLNIRKDIERLAASIDRKNRRTIDELQQKLIIIEAHISSENSKRLQHLKEQSEIAKELNLDINLFDNSDYMPIQDNVFKNMYVNHYYLRGFKAIDKEIENINNRTLKEQLIMESGYIETAKLILVTENNIASDQLRDTDKLVEKANIEKWFLYDFKSASINSLKKARLYLTLSILLGAIFGITYVLFLNILNNKRNI